MSPKLFRYFLLSLTITPYIVIAAIDSPSPSPSCSPHQRDALLQLKNSFIITETPLMYYYGVCVNTSYPKTASWRKDRDCCSWEGVACDNSTGNIVGLDLSCARLCGAIDSNSSLFSLRHLRSLSLFGNDLLGSTIPLEIGVFSRMMHLNISSSNVTGNVPTEISQLLKLVSLDLSGNWLEMQNPTMRLLISNLTQLEELDLSSVIMSGVDPTSMMNFSSSLISLSLSNCWLGGRFPDYIFQLPNLQKLDLSWNIGVNGTLPESNWSSSLAFLSLMDCSFAGGVPHSIGSLPRLTYLDLSGCSLRGKFPDNIFQLPNLQKLDLSFNSGLHGTLPESNWSSNLAFLSLGLCSFAGGVPRSIGSLSRLTHLDLSGNNFTGHVDFQTFSTLKDLRFLELSGVSISGEDATDANHMFPKLEKLYLLVTTLINFPCFLSSMPELMELDFSGSIIREFPGQCVNNDLSFPQLQRLDMSSCNLTKFPSFLPRSNKLRYLHLSGNMIEQIPSWFWGFGIDTLEVLDLGDNLIRGGLRLPWKRLARLYLRENLFNGSISPSICQRTHLQELELGQNNLMGVIPQCLGNLTDLVRLDLSSNSLTGLLPPSLVNYSSMQILDVSFNFIGRWPGDIFLSTSFSVIDLSSNKFDGPLPLPSDATYHYSVSNNNFSGEISSLICNATYLGILDLSNNNLAGTLPQCLKNVTIQLYSLNLRANGFQGSIPEIFHEQSSLRSLDFSRN